MNLAFNVITTLGLLILTWSLMIDKSWATIDMFVSPRTYTLTELGLFIGVVMASVSGTTVAIVTAWRTGQKVETGNKQIEKVTEKIDEVHVLTNSTATLQRNEIMALNEQVKTLIAHIAQQEQNRAVLAAEVKHQPSNIVGEVVLTLPSQTVQIEKVPEPSKIIHP